MQQPLHAHEMQAPAPAGPGLDEYGDRAFMSAPAEHVRGHVRAGVQVPTQPSQYRGSTGDEIFGILAEEVRRACSPPGPVLWMCLTRSDCRMLQPRTRLVLLVDIAGGTSSAARR